MSNVEISYYVPRLWGSECALFVCIQIERGCGSGNHSFDCQVLVLEIYHVPHYRSNFVNITCLEDCEDSGADDSWGLQEVKLYRPV